MYVTNRIFNIEQLLSSLSTNNIAMREQTNDIIDYFVAEK